MDDAVDDRATKRQLDELRGELSRLERERAVERGELRSAVARSRALQASLDEAHRHLNARGSVGRRAISKAHRIVGRLTRRITGR